MTSSTLRLPLFISAALVVGVAGANPRFNTDVRTIPNEGLTIAPKVEIVECHGKNPAGTVAIPNYEVRRPIQPAPFRGTVITAGYPARR